jgi:prepilin signal peptidase PulO-like enzyme (type II secretory pathway)
MGLLFVWSGWISLRFGYTWYDMMWWIFLFWTFVTGVYILYDLRYMEIPDQIMVPGILITAIFILLGYVSIDHVYLFDFLSYTTFHTFLTDHISSAIFIYSLFFLQILIPGTIFLIKQGDYKNVLRLLLSYFTFPFTVIIDFFRNNHTTDTSTELIIPTWIG